MNKKSDREELERRLEQVRRLSSMANDEVTRERMGKLIRDLEEQLREPE
jgi:chromosomal replication initiation ATPase DnaA